MRTTNLNVRSNVLHLNIAPIQQNLRDIIMPTTNSNVRSNARSNVRSNVLKLNIAPIQHIQREIMPTQNTNLTNANIKRA